MKEIKVIETPNITYSNYQMLKRVAAYARVSTKLEMQSSSLALQIKHYAKKIIFNPDYVFAGVYADHGKSGTSMKKRDGLQSLLKKVYGGHIDLVLVKSLSRFARNTLDALNIIKKTSRQRR
jgi:DNA invertase Pin-like site-specific DNA recombinase